MARVRVSKSKSPAQDPAGKQSPATPKTVTTKPTMPLKAPDAGRAKLELRKATGAANPNLQTVIANQVISALWLPSDLSAEKRLERMAAAISLLEGIKPQDELEGMLAAHMVATHSAAMECLRRAMIPEQSFEGRDAALRHAEKLLATYARQLEVLDKHRGKGQQQVTVKHITVGPGGQAVVGNVQTNARVPKADEQMMSSALTNQSGRGMEIVEEPARATTSAKRHR